MFKELEELLERTIKIQKKLKEHFQQDTLTSLIWNYNLMLKNEILIEELCHLIDNKDLGVEKLYSSLREYILYTNVAHVTVKLNTEDIIRFQVKKELMNKLMEEVDVMLL